MGAVRDELIPNLRSFPVGNYLIFYKPLPDGIEVLRVLHGARDLPPFFLPPDQPGSP
jgi:toxin ParE1/3/4